MMMRLSRRDFVRSGAVTALLGALPTSRVGGQPAVTHDIARLDTLQHGTDPAAMRALAQRAVDAARAAGATYADVRVTRTVTQRFDHNGAEVVSTDVFDLEELAIGVRALVNGYWGFAASPYWNTDEATQLAQSAVSQAKTNALGTARTVEWEPIAPAETGSWVAAGIDPFSVTIEEKANVINGWRQALLDIPRGKLVISPASMLVLFIRQEWCMVSTEGTALHQTLYTTAGNFPASVQLNDWRAVRNGKTTSVSATGLHIQRGGWDILMDAGIRNQIPTLMDTAERRLLNPVKPVEIGRYDVVFDAETMARVLAQTFGIATQLDRALGFEANASGTSYLGPDPMAFLGTAPVAAPLITITANRSQPKGAATVKWDDEGVVPDTFSLVKDGVLTDYQTTREQAAWLKPWYQRQQRPARSHGCASANTAGEYPLQQPPNLALEPGTTPATFETLVSGISRGLAVIGGGVFTDYQARNGTGSGLVQEIVDGKLGRICEGAGFLFSSSDIWKNVTAIGDASSVRHSDFVMYKGQPAQRGMSGVAAVPAAIKNVSIIDLRRRA